MLTSESFNNRGLPDQGRQIVSVQTLAGEVRLRWSCTDDFSAELSRFESMLSLSERAHVAAARTGTLRRSRLVSRAVLREELSIVTGRPAESLIIETDSDGKPFLSATLFSKIRFNLSHSANWCVHALSEQGFEIGVDLEVINAQTISSNLVEQVMSEKEQREWYALPEELRQHVFFQNWADKEAVLKATGCGLQGLQRYKRENVGTASCRGQVWQVIQLAAPLGFVASLAVPMAESR